MTTQLALEYISRRVAELGYSKDYHIRFRHLQLWPGEKRLLKAWHQLYVLIEPPGNVRIESDTGVFDLTETLTNELQYEHNGEILVTNYSIFINHVKFIQVIPKTSKGKCK